jgi:hypothetical protein
MRVFDVITDETIKRLRPEDFDTDTYMCVNFALKKHQPPFCVMRRKDAAFEYYKVMYGTSTLFYRDFEDVMKFVDEHGIRK